MKLVKISLCLFFVLNMTACSKWGLWGKSSNYEGSDGATIPAGEEGGILGDVRFAFDSSEIAADQRTSLDMTAGWLNDNAKAQVRVEGHCDERGTEEYNLALGDRRAQSVVDYLKALGVDTGRLETISYGESVPLVAESNPAAWAKNRRAHFSGK